MGLDEPKQQSSETKRRIFTSQATLSERAQLIQMSKFQLLSMRLRTSPLDFLRPGVKIP
jgi:hypothetical protein